MKITENTLIPITFLGAIIGGAFWLTMVYANGLENKEGIQKLQMKSEDRDEKIDSKLDLILERITRLETKLEKHGQ